MLQNQGFEVTTILPFQKYLLGYATITNASREITLYKDLKETAMRSSIKKWCSENLLKIHRKTTVSESIFC